MGEAVDVHGEGDGCDRCGCPDEEKCCPSFWQDRSVPPIWPLSWAFDPYNKYLNDNRCARNFGNIGFPFYGTTHITLSKYFWSSPTHDKMNFIHLCIHF